MQANPPCFPQASFITYIRYIGNPPIICAGSFSMSTYAEDIVMDQTFTDIWAYLDSPPLRRADDIGFLMDE